MEGINNVKWGSSEMTKQRGFTKITPMKNTCPAEMNFDTNGTP